MNLLSLHCHECHRSFPSGAYVDPSLARSLTIDGVVYQCPHCGLRDTYFSEEQTPWVPEFVSDSPRDPPGAGGVPISPGPPALLSRVWVGILVGVLLTVLATGVIHAVNPGVLSVIP
jgi:hypothetical protein